MDTPFAENQQILTPQSMNTMYTPASEITGIYTMGSRRVWIWTFSLKNSLMEKRPYGDGGQGYGWMSHFHSIPETGDGIVILTNSQRSWPLIAKVLQEWTQWREAESVQMSRIGFGITLMWILVSLLALTSIFLAFRLVHGLFHKTRFFSLSRLIRSPLKAIQCACGAAMIGAIMWALSSTLFDDYIGIPINILLGWDSGVSTWRNVYHHVSLSFS